MLIAALRTTAVLALLFAVVDVVFVLLALGAMNASAGLTTTGGVLGIVAAGLAWYLCAGRRHRINIRQADPAQPATVPTLSSACVLAEQPPLLTLSGLMQALRAIAPSSRRNTMSVPVESPSSTSVGDKVVTTAKVVLPAESLSGGTEVRDKVVTAAEAVRLIRDGDSVVVEGFVGQCFAEELTLALEQRFLLTGTPQDLTWCSPSPRATGRAAGWTGWLTTD